MTLKLIVLLSLLASAWTATVSASPFVARPLPAGFHGAGKEADTEYPYSYRRQSLVAADFLGNGKLQWYAGGTVITGFPGSDLITLPSYTLPNWTPAVLHPLAGLALDVDGDGDMDIFRINSWGGMSGYFTIAVFLNEGGTFTLGWRQDFQHAPPFNTGATFYQLRAGDFDRDGDLDIATLVTYQHSNYNADPDREEGALAIRWNDGTGKFTTATTLQSTGFRGDASVGVGDFDNDGDPDLVCSAQAYWGDDDLWHLSTRFFENNGSGGFTASSGPSNQVWGAQPVDINRDGWLELADAAYVSWNKKTGTIAGGFDGVFTWPWKGVGVIFSDESAFADVNGDGHVDLLQARAKSLLMRPGTGTGSFGEAVTLASFASEVKGMGAADSDADGDVDVLVALIDGSFVLVENRAHHWAAGASPAPSGNGVQHPLAGVTQLEAADFNQDGIDDLLAVTPSQNKLWVLYGTAGGVPAAPVFKNTQNTAPGGATVADFNRDGRPDVAYTLPSAGAVRLALNDNASPFGWSDAAIATDLPGVNLITAARHGSADGHQDLLTSSATTGRLRWLYRTGNSWIGQNVLNSASPAPAVIRPHNVTARPGDEPFYLSADGGTLRVRGYQLNPAWTGAGELTQAITASPHHPAMAWGDVNADGKDELVLVRGDGRLAYWTPGSPITLVIGVPPAAIRALEIVDWDRDGRADVLCATANGLSLYTWKNGWQREDIHTHSGGFTTLKVLDLNRDGLPDVAAATGTHVHFLKNLPRLLRAVASGPAAVTLTTGQSGTVMNVEASHQGHGAAAGASWLPDPEAAVTSVSMQLHRAVPDGDGWQPGSALTKAELSQILAGASLVAEGKVIGSSGPLALEDNGVLTINYNAVLGNLVPIAGGATQPLSLRFNPTVAAAQSSVAKFYLSVLRIKARLLDGDDLDRTVIISRPGIPRALVTILPNYTPLQQWRVDHFGAPDATGDRANDADFDHDGVPNLVEYALGANPAAAEPALNDARALTLLPFTTASSPVKFRLVVADGALGDPKVRLTVQRSTGLGEWTAVASRTGGGTWTGLQPDVAIPGGGIITHVFTTTDTPQNTPRLFLRLHAEELP